MDPDRAQAAEPLPTKAGQPLSTLAKYRVAGPRLLYERHIGQVTSCVYSPRLSKNIGYAMLVRVS